MKRAAGIVIFLIGCVAAPAHALDYTRYPKLVELLDVMVAEDGYPREQLEAVLNAAVIDPSVIRKMNRQYEALPWHQYRKRFLNAARIRKGVAYWSAHDATLQRAAQKFGVPPAIIVALIGVETQFGDIMGNDRVLDSLVTLSADYPRRSAYFSKELRAFLNTARTENIDPQSVTGSFAGAIGIPQFMPTSYQAYAVDFNDNGQRDLVNEPEDAIGSVANYLKRHGWKPNQPIVTSLTAPLPKAAIPLITKRAKPTLTPAQLTAAGIPSDPAAANLKTALLRLKEKQTPRHILAYPNFYALTRYNPSINYAMAVVELSREISELRER